MDWPTSSAVRDLLSSPQQTLHPKLRRLLPRPCRRGEGLLGVVYPAVLAINSAVYGVPALAGIVLSLEGGAKHLEILGKTASKRLKPGFHTLCPSILWLKGHVAKA